MEFQLTGTHGENITVKDYGKDSYLVTMPCGRSGQTHHQIVITKDQFKRLAKAS